MPIPAIKPDNLTPARDTDAEVQERPYKKERDKLAFQEDVWLYWVRVAFILLASIGSFAVVAIYIWHIVGPDYLRWMADADISKLKDLAITIIVGLLMSLTTSYFFKKQ